MKFGKTINEISSEWAHEYYINYKGLKKIITNIHQREGLLLLASLPIQGAVINDQTEPVGIAFFYQLERGFSF
jgi:hypothetical protein